MLSVRVDDARRYYAPTRPEKPRPSLFISYARADGQFANELAIHLRSIADIRVVLDPDSAELGTSNDHEMANAIREAQVVVVLLSKHLKEGQFVHHETATALKSSSARTIVPVLLDDEARDNLVWPLVADRTAVVGSDARHVGSAVVELALRPSPKQSRVDRRSNRVLKLLVSVLVVILSITGVLMVASPKDNRISEISVSIESRSSDGSSLTVGQIVNVITRATDLLLIYRDDHLVTQCPSDPRCTRRENGWTLQLLTSAPGSYRIVAGARGAEVHLIGQLDMDVAMLARAGWHLYSLDELIVR